MSDTGERSRTRTGDTAEPILVVVCGPPGVGKTTVAEAIADRVDGRLLRTDVIRKELAPDPAYTQAETDRVYDELLSRAHTSIQHGAPVVLDGTFRRRAYRDQARQLAASTGVAFELARVTCDETTVRERLAERNGDASDADAAVYATIREEFEQVEGDHITVDNSADPTTTRQQLEPHF